MQEDLRSTPASSFREKYNLERPTFKLYEIDPSSHDLGYVFPLVILTDSCCSFSVKSKSNMICMGRGSILENYFSLQHGTGKVLQILQLVKTSVSENEKELKIILKYLIEHYFFVDW